MSIKKQYLKTRPVCKTTFCLSQAVSESVDTVFVVGEFNDWDTVATPMKKLKNGSFSVTINLKPESEYQFRYLLDSHIWENDLEADKYIRSPFGDCDNSVVVV